MVHLSENGDGPPGGQRWHGARVIDAAGHPAEIVSTEYSGAEEHACIRLDGTQVMVPVSLLARQQDGAYRLPFSFDARHGQTERAQMSFPVLEEQMQVDKRVVETGRGIRIHKAVVEHERVLDEPLRRDELAVEHVPIGRIVADGEPPQVRYEGDTLVVPVLEEVLVVQKQLLLKEEVRVTRRQRQVQEPQTVVLRSEQVSVERFDEGSKTAPQ